MFDGDEERSRVEETVHRMVDRALEMQGTCTVSNARQECRPFWRKSFAFANTVSGRRASMV